MKKEKLTLDEFREITLDQILSLEDLQRINGGNGNGSGTMSYSYDCVLNCFDYLDGDRHDYDYYKYSINYGLGYDPYGMGGVYTGDIATIGGYGGFTVTELTGGSFNLDSNGKSDGLSVMMTYDAGGSGDHAVVVTGYENRNGSLFIKYYDPTTKSSGIRTAHSGNYYTVE